MSSTKQIMKVNIEILGPGCAKCKTLDRLVREVIDENGWDAEVTKVEDIMQIMQYNILITPALVINGKVVSKGSVPSKKELTNLIANNIHG